MMKKIKYVFSRFHTTHERDIHPNRRTDGQTDKQTDGDRATTKTALYIASRGKNQWQFRLTSIQSCN